MKTTDFAQHLTKYLSHYLVSGRNYSDNTVISYRDTFKLLLRYCRDVKGMNVNKLTISQLDKRCIKGFLEWLATVKNCSVATYNQRLYAIRAFFDYVQMEAPEHIAQCQEIQKIPGKKTPDKPVQCLRADNLEQVLQAPDTSTARGRRHLVILTVLYDTAARVSELTGIRIRDVRLEAPASITLHGKNDKIHTVPLMRQTVDLLKEYYKENRINPATQADMPLFWGAHRNKLSRSGIRYIVEKYVGIAKAGTLDMPQRISPHTFRHTKAMHLVQGNVNSIYIKDYLGHADLATTQIYARADNETKRAALEQASANLRLGQSCEWEKDAELIEWLSSLG